MGQFQSDCYDVAAPLGAVVWITGVPASGKTTLARHVVRTLHGRGVAVLWLDSDDLRAVMTPAPTYSEEERDVFYATLRHIAVRAARGGVFTVVSATACRRSYREATRSGLPAGRFAEVLLHCDQASLRERDVKGLYRRSHTGQVRALPGVDVPYEEPLEPDLMFDTAKLSSEATAESVLTWLNARWPTLTRTFAEG